MRTLLLFILVAAHGAGAQTAPPKGLTDSERALVEGSREAIIKTGMSAAFFDEHFRVQSVVDRAGDRRVVWRLSVGGYEASVNDTIGFYTEGARRAHTHSVAATLGETSDITRTVTRRRAESVMRRCIGRFAGTQVEYRAHGAGGRAALLLTAHSLVPPRREGREERARRELEERARRERARAGDERTTDEIGEEGEEGGGPVVLLGAVDLVTGACTVGYGQAGPRPPEPARHRR